MKKIIDYIKKRKKFVIGLVLVVIIIIGFICCSIKPKALAFEIDYQDFDYVCGVSHTEVDSSDLLVDLEIIAMIQNNKLVYEIDSIGSARLINGDPREILVDNVYLIKYDSQGGIIQRYALLDDFIADSNGYYYENGYSASVTDTPNQSYDNGYNIGYEEGLLVGIETQNSIISDKNSTIAQQQETINDLTEALQESDKGFKFATFGQLMSAIVSYPIQFFKEGLNVEVFGINVGAFIVAIVLISVTIGVIGIVLHGRNKE